MDISLSCRDFSVLSKRLVELDIKVPRYKKTDKPDDDIHAIAIDSTGLKRFERGEWHQEKYELLKPVYWLIDLVTMTSKSGHCWHKSTNQLIIFWRWRLDSIPVYAAVIEHSPNDDVVIPPRVNAVENDKSAPLRNRNIIEIEINGRMQWQKEREYGRRNYSELGVQRYQRTFGDAKHAWDFPRQQQEARDATKPSIC